MDYIVKIVYINDLLTYLNLGTPQVKITLKKEN